MKQAFLFALLLVAVSLSAQNYTRSFRTCFSTGRRSATRTPLQASATDSLNNLYIAGYVNLYPDNVNDSIYLRKYDPKGNVLWEVREYSKGTTAWSLAVPLKLTVDKAGNAFLAYSYSFVQSNLDAVVAKYSPAGAKLWQTTFDGPEDIDNEQITSLAVDGKGSTYLLVKENYNYATFAKLNPKGKLLWYRDMKGIIVDGTFTDYQVTGGTIDSAGNAYATGFTARLHNGLYHDVLTYKFLANGDSGWQKRFGSSYTDHFGYKVLYAKGDNSIIVGGYTETQHSDSILAIKYTAAAGRLQWTYINRQPPQSSLFLGQAAVDADNNLVLVTNFNIEFPPPPYLTKLLPSGSVLWTKYAYDQPASAFYSGYAFDLKTDGQSNYYLASIQENGVRVQKFSAAGTLMAQVSEVQDSATILQYAGLSVGKDQSIYCASSFQNSYFTDNSCVSRYALKGVATADRVVTGAPAMTAATGAVYPNPARDVVYLPTITTGAPYTAAVYDAMGKEVMRKQGSTGQTALFVGVLAKGMYLLRVSSNGNMFTYKIMKE